MSEGIRPLADMPPKLARKITEDYTTRLDLDLPSSALVGFKGYPSAWRQPSIAEYIRLNNITNLILSGVYECPPKINLGYLRSFCVSSTARDFSQECKNVTIAAEATNCGIPGAKYFSSVADRKKHHSQFGVDVAETNDILKALDSAYRPAATSFISMYSSASTLT